MARGRRRQVASDDEEQPEFKPYHSKAPQLLRELAGYGMKSISDSINIEEDVRETLQADHDEESQVEKEFGLVGDQYTAVDYSDREVCVNIGKRAALHPLVKSETYLKQMFGTLQRFRLAPQEVIKKCKAEAVKGFETMVKKHPDAVDSRLEREKIIRGEE